MSTINMETNIVSQIAQQVFYKNAKVPEELQTKSDNNVVKKDKVSLSNNAVSFQNSKIGENSANDNHDFQVQRIKSLVQSGNYKMDSK
ncbi:MAG: flagellar biosynthesis anti-sigma factor FlgM, partial [Fibrobacteria bacterium]|nr:flagellar biosynthesis anti-sigma factor FlgM [Fibrobacteria bacterium]